MLTLANIESLHKAALVAAVTAEEEFRAKHGEPMYCGFAWVTVPEKGSTKMGRALMNVGFTKAYGGGLQLWNPGGSYTQSMDVKEIGANAYAKVFRGAGIDAYMGSRAD